MALTRKFLSAMGIDDDKIDQIIEAHSDTLKGLKAERDNYRDKVEEADELQKKLDKANEKLKEYEDSKNDEGSWKTKYEAEKTAREKAENDLKDYKTAATAKELLSNKQTAYKNLLKEAGISDKRFDAILRVTDFDKIDLDDNQKIKDADKISDAIKEEWKEFITTTSVQGAGTATPPANNGGNSSGTPSKAAQAAEKYYADLYGTKKED